MTTKKQTEQIQTRRIAPAGQRGFALVAVLLILVVMSAMGAGYLLSTTTEAHISSAEVDRMMAQNMAESGLAWAVNRIKRANWLQDVDRDPAIPNNCLFDPGDQVGHYLHTVAIDGASWNACLGHSDNFDATASLEDQYTYIVDHQHRGPHTAPDPGDLAILPRDTGFRVWAERDDEINAWRLNSIGHSGRITARSELTFRTLVSPLRFVIFADRYAALNSYHVTGIVTGGIWSNGELELSRNVTVTANEYGMDGIIGENPATGVCDDEYVASLGHFSSAGTIVGNLFASSADGWGPDGRGCNPRTGDFDDGSGNTFTEGSGYGSLTGTLYLLQAYQRTNPLQTDDEFQTLYEKAMIRSGSRLTPSYLRRFNPYCGVSDTFSSEKGRILVWPMSATECDPDGSGRFIWYDDVNYNNHLPVRPYYCGSAESNCGDDNADCNAMWGAPYPQRTSSCINEATMLPWDVDNTEASTAYDDLEFDNDPPLGNVLVRRDYPQLNYDYLEDLAQKNYLPPHGETQRTPDDAPVGCPECTGTYFQTWAQFRDYIRDATNDLVWAPGEPGNPYPSGSEIRVLGHPSNPSVFYVADTNDGGIWVPANSSGTGPQSLYVNGSIVTNGKFEVYEWHDWGPGDGRPRKSDEHCRFWDITDPTAPNRVLVPDGIGPLVISNWNYPAIAAKRGFTYCYSDLFDTEPGYPLTVFGLIYVGELDEQGRFVDETGTPDDTLGRVYIDPQGKQQFTLNGAICARDVEVNWGSSLTWHNRVLDTQGFLSSKNVRDLRIIGWRLSAD